MSKLAKTEDEEAAAFFQIPVGEPVRDLGTIVGNNPIYARASLASVRLQQHCAVQCCIGEVGVELRNLWYWIRDGICWVGSDELPKVSETVPYALHFLRTPSLHMPQPRSKTGFVTINHERLQ